MPTVNLTQRRMRALGITPGNTQVAVTQEGDMYMVDITLHGHLIGMYVEDVLGDRLTLDPCGWYTPTTKKRMNQFLEMLGLSMHVYQEDFSWYLWWNDPSFDEPRRVPMDGALKIDINTCEVKRLFSEGDQ